MSSNCFRDNFGSIDSVNYPRSVRSLAATDGCADILTRHLPRPRSTRRHFWPRKSRGIGERGAVSWRPATTPISSWSKVIRWPTSRMFATLPEDAARCLAFQGGNGQQDSNSGQAEAGSQAGGPAQMSFAFCKRLRCSFCCC